MDDDDVRSQAVIDCDLAIVGSGAAGLSAAVTAAANGLRVHVFEKASVLGGTTAWSGGWIFAPRNPVARRTGIHELFEAPFRYLSDVLDGHFDEARVKAFLIHAPRMVEFFENETELQFEGGNHIPDTYGEVPGAGTGGRSVIAAPFDARQLGRHIGLLRRPLPETTFLGMTIQAGPDLRAFMTMARSWPAFKYVARRFSAHLRDLAFHGRGMELRNGNALIARLLLSALRLNVTFHAGTSARRLLIEGGRTNGVVVASRTGEIIVKATRGVVLASGGFSQNADLCRRYFPAAEHHHPLAIPETVGDGCRMAEEIGASFDDTLASPAAWCPVSQVPWPDGRQGVFPHIIDRGKPGIIAVTRDGRRFCNEAMGYHDFVTDLLAATPAGQVPESWLICTRAFQRRYGLGISRPSPVPYRSWVKRGYLVEARTTEELAAACGIDPQGLAATIKYWNCHARQGQDPAFGRGSTPYQRLQGDPDNKPNPCVAPIEQGPFLALRVVPGSFGCFAGIRTDDHARVLDTAGRVIPGLFSAGTDSANVMGGYYPAGGINIGPAMTFGYIAGRTAADLPHQEDIDIAADN
ncbi:MAG: FAD-dependent oxidoreductase [Rhizobiaceae bacterium]